MSPPPLSGNHPVVPPSEPSWAVRLEAKLDVALSHHTARIDSQEREVADHETRLRVLESKSTVSPSALWSSVLGGITGMSALLALLYTLYPK